MKMYKCFNKDMTFQGLRFKEGHSYDSTKLHCEDFCAWESPIDCLESYFSTNAIYHEVILEMVDETKGEGTMRYGKRITIGKRLSVAEMCEANSEYVRSLPAPSWMLNE